MARPLRALFFDLDDTVYIPAARGLELFNRVSLFEIDILYDEDADMDKVVERVKKVLTARHGRARRSQRWAGQLRLVVEDMWATRSPESEALLP